MKKLNVFERNLSQFQILDNGEGDINSVWKDEGTGEFFMESMIEWCEGYIYFKTSKKNILKFLDQKITLKELYEKGLDDEIFIRIFKNHSIQKRKELCEIKLYYEGFYEKIGVGDLSGSTEYFDRIRKNIELG